MSHPDARGLALFAGGELPPWSRWRISRHVKQCPECLREVEIYNQQTEMLQESASELPVEVNWGRLAAEMKGNIQVGLAADECVASAEPAPQNMGWRMAAAVASITVVIIGGWWLHMPPPQVAVSQWNDGQVLAATPVGIELKQEDRALTLMQTGSEPLLVSISAQGAMEARFIDDETGMVTINNVYVQ